MMSVCCENHHHWQNSPFSTTAFLRTFCQIRLEVDSPVFTYLDFATIIFIQRQVVILAYPTRNLEDQVSAFMSRRWQGGPVIPPVTGLPFLRLLRLAGLRSRYSDPPPQGNCENHTKTQKYTTKFRNVKAHGTYSYYRHLNH
jgi:hypothetical protein